MPINLIIRNPLDRDAREFIGRANVTDAAARLQLNEFVRGIKQLGLWSNLVCWPLRSSQNDSTSTTAYSLGGLGTYNGTLVNGPTWESDGINFLAASNTLISTALDVQNLRQFTAMVAANQTSQASASDGMMAAWGATSASSYFILRKTATNVFNALTRSAAATRQTSISGGVVTAGVWLMHGWGTQGANMVPTMNGVAGASLAFLPDETGSSQVNIGAFSTAGSFYNGRIAWAMFFKDNELTTAQQLSVYTLYKQTLGTGLGLP